MDNDGIINKEDIRIVLSYITLDDSPDIKSSGINITYKKRVTSQEELYLILQKCFENIPNNKMNLASFKNVIENVNSDIYLMIYMFLLENKPFTKENIKSYKKGEKSKKKESEVSNTSNKNLIMSPSKNSNFSPYKAFLRGKARRSTVLNKDVDISKMLQSTDPSLKKGNEGDFKRKGRKRRTVQYESNNGIIKDIQGDEAKRKIKQERIKDLTRKRQQNKDLPEEQLELKPAFLQKIKKNENSNSKPKNKKKKNKGKNGKKR
jgi:hypothetical protein